MGMRRRLTSLSTREHQVTDDHMGRPLAGRRGTVEPGGRDSLDELRNGDEALAKNSQLLVPVLGHPHTALSSEMPGDLARRPPGAAS
jgi:hypothetical protein